jgi:hypothetical protein
MNMKYECWAYVNGKPDKMTYVSAPSNAEAQILAMEKFDKLGVKYDYVKCK